MTVREFAEQLHMKIFTGEAGLEKEVTGMYVCDLLSWVMSHANKGDAWITVLTNLNIVAVALLTEVSCIIIPEGIEAEAAAVQKAEQEGIAILSSPAGAYEICGRTYALLDRG